MVVKTKKHVNINFRTEEDGVEQSRSIIRPQHSVEHQSILPFALTQFKLNKSNNKTSTKKLL